MVRMFGSQFAQAIAGGAVGAAAVVTAALGAGSCEGTSEEPAAAWGTDFKLISPVVGPAPLPVWFQDASWDDTSDEATVNAWSWDFGDGTPPVSCRGAGCGSVQSIRHLFETPGWYMVSLSTNGTHAGTLTRIGLVRVVSVATDIRGVEVRPNLVALTSSSGDWTSLTMVLDEIGATGVTLAPGAKLQRIESGEALDLELPGPGAPILVRLAAP